MAPDFVTVSYKNVSYLTGSENSAYASSRMTVVGIAAVVNKCMRKQSKHTNFTGNVVYYSYNGVEVENRLCMV